MCPEKSATSSARCRGLVPGAASRYRRLGRSATLVDRHFGFPFERGAQLADEEPQQFGLRHRVFGFGLREQQVAGVLDPVAEVGPGDYRLGRGLLDLGADRLDCLENLARLLVYIAHVSSILH